MRWDRRDSRSDSWNHLEENVVVVVVNVTAKPIVGLPTEGDKDREIFWRHPIWKKKREIVLKYTRPGFNTRDVVCVTFFFVFFFLLLLYESVCPKKGVRVLLLLLLRLDSASKRIGTKKKKVSGCSTTCSITGLTPITCHKRTHSQSLF